MLLSSKRLKKRTKNVNHRREVSSLMLRNAKKKLDNLKDEVEAKDNEGGDIFILFKKGFEHSDDKIDYKKAIIDEILSLEEIDND